MTDPGIRVLFLKKQDKDPLDGVRESERDGGGGLSAELRWREWVTGYRGYCSRWGMEHECMLEGGNVVMLRGIGPAGSIRRNKKQEVVR